MFTKSLVVAGFKGVSTFVVGFMVLWHVVENAVPPYGTVVVHVALGIDRVSIDELMVPIPGWTTEPIVQELHAGDHVLRGWMGDRLVYEDSFTLRRGEEAILTAWPARVTATP